MYFLRGPLWGAFGNYKKQDMSVHHSHSKGGCLDLVFCFSYPTNFILHSWVFRRVDVFFCGCQVSFLQYFCLVFCCFGSLIVCCCYFGVVLALSF